MIQQYAPISIGEDNMGSEVSIDTFSPEKKERKLVHVKRENRTLT